MDKGQRATERNMKRIVHALRSVYSKATKDLLLQIQAYTKPFEKEEKHKKWQLKHGFIKESDYDYWLKNEVFRGEKWNYKVKSVLSTIVEANRNALRIIRGGQLDNFADNANFYADDLMKTFKNGMRLTFFDRYTVERILRENPKLLPEKVLNVAKDTIWNRGKINNAITQGIIQGESVPKIANRIASQVAYLNKEQKTRYARTAITSAQNAGRLEQMMDAKKKGIHVQKKWLATNDSRVRDVHLHLDGQIREPEEPFDSDLGEIMFPADPSADPANVWNCRCCLVAYYPDIQKEG